MMSACHWLKMYGRKVPEDELPHLLNYLPDFACDAKISDIYKRVCRMYERKAVEKR